MTLTRPNLSLYLMKFVQIHANNPLMNIEVMKQVRGISRILYRLYILGWSFGDRKSRVRYDIYFDPPLVLWSVKKQQIVASSSNESEY